MASQTTVVLLEDMASPDQGIARDMPGDMTATPGDMPSTSADMHTMFDMSSMLDMRDEGDLRDDRADLEDMPRTLAPRIVRGGRIAPGAHGLAMDEAGIIYYSDTYRNEGAASQVYRLPPPYNTSQPLEITGTTVSGLYTQGDLLLVTDTGGSTVRIYRQGVLEDTLQATQPWNITRAPEGWVTATYANTVELLAVGTSPTTLFGGLAFSFDIVYDSDEDAFWVSESEAKTVRLRARDGQILREIDAEAASFEVPEGIALDPRGVLWVADTGASKIHGFDPVSGELEHTIEVAGMPIMMSNDPRDGDVIYSINGLDSAWWKISWEPAED